MGKNKAMDVANYLVYHALSINLDISHLKLQKVLYFLEAHYLIKFNQPLIKESFEKWRLGPVIPEVYHEYKTFGPRPITRVPMIHDIFFDNESEDFNMTVEQFDPNEVSITNEDKTFIKKFSNPYLEEDAFSLVEKTHQHKLWSDFESQIISGERELFYEKDDMREYFLENRHYLEDLHD